MNHIDKFYRAAIFSGVVKKTRLANYSVHDIDLALKLVDEIIAHDPTNSASYLLKARIYDSQNKTAEAKQVLDLAEEKTNHFDTYMLTLNRKLFDISEGAADVLASHELRSPLLHFSSQVIQIIIKYKKIRLGEQIMKPASDDSKLLVELEWSSWDYQNAKYSLEEIIPGKKFPDHMEIHPKKNKILAKQFPEFDPEGHQSKLKEKDDHTVECDYTKLEEILSLYRKALYRSK